LHQIYLWIDIHHTKLIVAQNLNFGKI